MPNCDFGQNSVPAANPKPPYNPGDYGLPVWRDEDHLPPQETVTAERKSQMQTADSMTVEAAKNKLCAWAISQIGYHEGPDNQTKYAENVDLQRMYGWKPQNQPWCDVFVDDGFIACFGVEAAAAMTYQPMGAGSALCSQSAEYYQERGAWIPRGKTPEIGDQAFFYASGDINHTGIVVRVDGSSVHTVEGNSSDMVAERVYSVSDSKIAGYGRPDWSVAQNIVSIAADHIADDGKKDERRFYELRLPYLCRGSVGAPVTAVQFQLMGQGYNGLVHMNSTWINVGIAPDGIVGPATGAKLFGGEVYTPSGSAVPADFLPLLAEYLQTAEFQEGFAQYLERGESHG